MLRARAVGLLVFTLLFFFGLMFFSLHGDDLSTSFVVPLPQRTREAPANQPQDDDGDASPHVPVRGGSNVAAGATTMVGRAANGQPTARPNAIDRGEGTVHDDEGTDNAPPLPPLDLLPCAREYFEANFLQSVASKPPGERRAAVIPEAGIDQVYMIHYTPMKKRRVAMTERMRKHGVAVNWVEGFDKGVLNASTAACFHAWDPKAHKGPKAHRHDLRKLTPLGSSQRSVVIKHHSAIYDMYRMGYRHALVLEDDALLRVQFRRHLAEVMREVPLSYDVVMIGGCMNMHAYRRKFSAEMLSKHLYRKREARCAHAFVVSQKGARNLLSSLPLTHAIDFQMTAAMEERSMEVYWVEPWLSVQGPSDECVTSIDLGAGCGHTTPKKIGKDFDERFVNDTEADAAWDYVPAFRSKR